MTKFRDYDALFKSYQELEKQFTKKCQQLAQLSGTSSVTHPTGDNTPPPSDADFFEKYPQALQYRQKILDAVNSPTHTDHGSSYMDSYIDCLQQEVSQHNNVNSQQCVDNALTIAPTLPITISGNNGSMSLAVPSKPRTIGEASKMAQEIFN